MQDAGGGGAGRRRGGRARVMGRQHEAAAAAAAAMKCEMPDALRTGALDARLWGHAGFPEATDALAYDPVQRLLGIGTADGRVKVVGGDGVEALFLATSRAATRHLQFLEGKAALLRLTMVGWRLGGPTLALGSQCRCLLAGAPEAQLTPITARAPVSCAPGSATTGLSGGSGVLMFCAQMAVRQLWSWHVTGCMLVQDGELQLWGIQAGGMLDTFAPAGDQVTAVTVLPGEPYCALGCLSGALAFLTILDGEGQPVLGAHEAAAFAPLPYQCMHTYAIVWMYIALVALLPASRLPAKTRGLAFTPQRQNVLFQRPCHAQAGQWTCQCCCLNRVDRTGIRHWICCASLSYEEQAPAATCSDP